MVLQFRPLKGLSTDVFHWWWKSPPPQTLQAPGTRLSVADEPATPDPVLHRRYRAIVGTLGWLNKGTRPDISHAYSELCNDQGKAYGRCRILLDILVSLSTSARAFADLQYTRKHDQAREWRVCVLSHHTCCRLNLVLQNLVNGFGNLRYRTVKVGI